jgi:hypothetical protein
MRLTFLSLMAVPMFAFLLAGCSGAGVKKVTGMVTLDGKALEGADVRFVPKEDPKLGEFGGRTGADGKFSITVGGPGMMAHPGQYVAVITKGQAVGAPKITKPPKSEEELKEAMKATAPGSSAGALPERYGNPKTSPFPVEIMAGTTELAPFELKSNP